MFWEDVMIISELDQVMCENRNAELLIQEVYRINPSIKFTILDDMITEHEALVLYNTLSDTPTAKARWVLIYIHFQIYSKAYKTNKFL